ALAGAPAETAERATPPATIAPIRKATTAVSATVTSVKRRDISIFHYKLQKPVLIQGFDAELARFLEFAARVGPGNDVAGFLADRARHSRSEPFERFGRLLAGHTRQRPGQDHRLARQSSWLVGRLWEIGRHSDAGLLEAFDQRLVDRLLGERPYG